MSKIPTTTQLNPKELFDALGVSMDGINEDQQARIATFLAKSARSLKHAIKDHEKGISIESQLVSALSLTSEQASMSSAPFHQILQDEGKDTNLMESNISKGKKKKDNKIQSDESSSESDSSSSSDEKSSSSSESDDYISMAEQQVPITGRIRKYQGKFIQIPFNLTGETGVTQVGNLVTISSTSAQNSIFLNRIFNEGVWRIYFQFLKGNIESSVIGVAEPSFGSNNYLGNDKLSMDYTNRGSIFQNGSSVYGSKSYSINDIIGFEVDMISHRIFFFHTFEQQPVCLINIPANLKVGITYQNASGTQYKVVAVYKLNKPLADPTKSPTIKAWTS
ncbi:MAG: hypothetical protein EZS28_013828 [Streblomastix strix]|uniref:SPRY domain-containing protein n=1 Tax=Streblomastix strix TaxID=222440 RepID=A0A5J4W733_9EUKA|nr:MAG: hypothetical protein EZS28_013828 [Streblomastix strix]